MKEFHRDEKTATSVESDKAVKQHIKQVKAERMQNWGHLFKQHRDEVRAFEQGGRSAIRRIWYAAGDVTRSRP